MSKAVYTVHWRDVYGTPHEKQVVGEQEAIAELMKIRDIDTKAFAVADMDDMVPGRAEVIRPAAPKRLLLNNPEACGMGMDHDCCAWLLVGAKGFECGRVTEQADYLRKRALGLARPQFVARRLPEEPYPQCQKFA